MTQHNFIWLDLETTGLDPRLPGARILEVAAVLAADDREGDLSIVQEFSAPIRATDADLKAAWASMDLNDSAFVHQMHTKNGLLAECAESDVTTGEVDDYLFSWCQEFTGVLAPKGLTLAGFSVHFDRDWIRVHLPKFASCLSHRVFDISTLKAAAKILVAGYAPAKGDAHRSLEDVKESLRAYAEWRSAVGL